MAPSQMQAIKSISNGKAEIKEVPLPQMRDDCILVKVNAVALNPTDWKHVDFLASENATVGCDYAGTVEEVGSEVTKKFQKGDRIAGFAHGTSATRKEDGCFAEYAMVKGDIQIKIPDNVSDEEAATLGVGISTVGQGLYQSLKLPLPSSPAKVPIWVLVYGGSTATGSLAIQFAKLSGCKVVTTCSPHNNSFVESLGAEKAFDYNSSSVGADIRSYTNNELTHAFDCISEGSSPKICGEALSSKGGKISFLLPNEKSKTGREDIEVASTLAYTINGKDLTFAGNPIPAQPQDFEFGREFWELARQLLADGKVKVHRPDVRQGGLKGVFEGLDEMRKGKVSGVKLVYKL